MTLEKFFLGIFVIGSKVRDHFLLQSRRKLIPTLDPFLFYNQVYSRGNLRSVMANVLYCDILVSEFELHLRYYVHFRTNALRKGMNLRIFTGNELNSTAIVFNREGFSIK